MKIYKYFHKYATFCFIVHFVKMLPFSSSIFEINEFMEKNMSKMLEHLYFVKNKQN